MRSNLPGDVGLIPAYAGSTTLVPIAATTHRAHPRLRGEHLKVTFSPSAPRGSSPLTRGAPHHRIFGLRVYRLIPAYAGSTTPPPHLQPRPWAHPRLRGEHVRGNGFILSLLGSSPLTRGAPLLSRNNMSLRAILHTASSGG